MIPRRNPENPGKTHFADDYTLHYISHLEAVALVAVRTLRAYASEGHIKAIEVLKEIESSGWKP